MSIALKLLALAARREGIATNEITDELIGSTSNRAHQLMVAGKLIRAGLKRDTLRYFTNAADAERYTAEQLEQRQARVQAVHAAAPKPFGHAPWSADEPARIPPHVKVQICPAFMPRFSEVETPHIHGGNQRGRIALRDIPGDTSWA